MSGVLICIVPTAVSVSVYTIRPHRCTEGHTPYSPQTSGKGKGGSGYVKMSLNSQYPVRGARCGSFWMAKGRYSSVSSEQGLLWPSRGAKEAKRRYTERSRHRKLSLLKSEPATRLQSFKHDAEHSSCGRVQPNFRFAFQK